MKNDAKITLSSALDKCPRCWGRDIHLVHGGCDSPTIAVRCIDCSYQIVRRDHDKAVAFWNGLKRPEKCPRCNGAGVHWHHSLSGSTMTDCDVCDGLDGECGATQALPQDDPDFREVDETPEQFLAQRS